MKRMLLFLIFAISLTAGSLPAQTDPLQYFPLDSGNVWQYYVTLLNPDPPDSNYYMTLRVSRDTIMPNGRRYKVLDRLSLSWFSPSLVRIDSGALAVAVYSPYSACPDSEVTSIRLALDSLMYHDCRGVMIRADSGYSRIGIIQDTARYQAYSWFDGISNYYILHEGIGISFFRQWELAGWQGILNAAIINGVQYGTFVGGLERPDQTPEHFLLDQNYPNPFNSSTTIKFAIPKASNVMLKVYDLLGQEVATLVNEPLAPGTYERVFNAEGLSSGVYFYRIFASGFTQTRKLLLLR